MKWRDEFFMKKIISCVVAVTMSIVMPLGQFKIFADSDQTLFINEVMASNKSVLRDGDIEDAKNGNKGGAYSDWIEIYNHSDNPIDLTGYTLSDDGATWTFPHGVVPPSGYLMVWASDKNKVAKDNGLHSNFKLSSSGETLTLKKPDGTVIDSIAIPALSDDESFGRTTNGSSEFTVFVKSTPCDDNSKGSIKIKEPQFSHDGGFYTEAFDLTLQSDQPGVKIYFTKDGSDPVPGNSGTYEYDDKIVIKSRAGDANEHSMTSYTSYDWLITPPIGEVFKCSIIKAIAIGSDGSKSQIVTHSYFVDPNIKTRYNLPIISIVTDNSNLFDPLKGIYANYRQDLKGEEWERPVHVEFFEKGGIPGFSHYCGMRLHGGYSKELPQKALRLYADRGYDDTEKIEYNIFPDLKDISGKEITSFKRLILRNAGNDCLNTMLRDGITHSLVSHMNLDTQAYRPSILFLNGEYWGIHNIRERYDNIYFASHYGLDKDKVSLIEFPFMFPYDGVLNINEGTEEDAKAYKNDIAHYINSNDMSSKSAYEYIKTKMDIDNYINYQIANIYFANLDWLKNNVTIWKYKTDDGLYHPEAPYGQDGRWRWIIKDMDWSFGFADAVATHNTLEYASTVYDTETTQLQKYNCEVYILGKLLENPEFRTEFINRFADHLNTSFSFNVVNNKIDEMKSAIESSIPEHIDRWSTISDWQYEIDTLKSFALNRTPNIKQHIVNKFSAYGVNDVVAIKLNTDTTKGYIKINSLDIKSSTHGVTNPESWIGAYFAGVPVTIKAIPEAGYKFDHWEGVAESDQKSQTITVNPSLETNLTAVFVEDKAPSIMCGDIDGDGKINAADYTLLRRYLLRIIPQLPVPFKNADLNNDNRINVGDLTLLRKFILGIINELP